MSRPKPNGPIVPVIGKWTVTIKRLDGDARQIDIDQVNLFLATISASVHVVALHWVSQLYALVGQHTRSSVAI